MLKDTQPGKWDTSVGGHVDLGETIEQALLRETKEELNITGINPIPLAQYKWESEIESELVFSFRALYNATPVFNKKEIDDGRFWNFNEINENLGKGIFTPNFENEVPILLKILGKGNPRI
jgi:NADH pyrophosphatase NudC (nudix superfamily)